MGANLDRLRRRKDLILRRIDAFRKRQAGTATVPPPASPVSTVSAVLPAPPAPPAPMGAVRVPRWMAVVLGLGFLGLYVLALAQGWAGRGNTPDPAQSAAPAPMPAPVAAPEPRPSSPEAAVAPPAVADVASEAGLALLLQRAEELLATGRAEEVPALLEGRVQDAPALLRKKMCLALGRAYEATGRKDRSLAWILRAAGSDGDGRALQDLFSAAESYFHEGRFEEASHLYYTFLAQADLLASEDKDLETKAYFRLAQGLKERALREGAGK